MSSQSPITFAIAGAIIAAGILYTALKPDGYEVHRQQLVDVFNLPDDAEFVNFHSPYGRNGLQMVSGVVRFPNIDSLMDYADTLDDAALWDPTGFAFDGDVVTASAPPSAVQWHDGEYAWMGDGYASFWVNWGIDQAEDMPDGVPSIYDSPAWRSFCFGVMDEAGGQRIASCGDYKHRPPGLQFYARAKLSRQDRLLFMVIR